MAGEVSGVEEFAQQFVGRVLDHLHLFEDHFLLAIQIVLVEARVREEVGEQIKCLGQTSVRNLYGETGHLMGRKRVKVSPQPIGFNGNVASRAALGPFENRVFDEMADAVEFRRFVTRATSHPNAGGYRPQTGHVLSQNRDAVGESG